MSVSVGLVGCGGMGHRHLRAYAELRRIGVEFEVTAVCDPRADAAEHAADEVSVFQGSRPKVYLEISEMIAGGDTKALDLVTDPAAHHSIAVPALEAGLHVICEKPLGVTVRAARAILDAASRSGAILATAENYRRDPPNRLARAVIEAGLLGEIHLLVQLDVGGDDRVVISPWRHVREAGSIALDMGVHYTDIFHYLMGDLSVVWGSAFIAEPFRRLPDETQTAGLELHGSDRMRATGADSLVATYECESGAHAQLAYIPSGPGRHWRQRTLHGRSGSLEIPPDRSGGPVIARLGERTLSGVELAREVEFELTGTTAALFGTTGVEYDLPFPDVDSATIAIELADFIHAIEESRCPEVDGADGLKALAAVWAVAESRERGASVAIAEVESGELSSAQDPIDRALGLLAT